jgi:hypothetical protein
MNKILKTESIDMGVEMVGEGEPKIVYDYYINEFGALGKEVKISPKQLVMFHKKGYKLTINAPAVSLAIGIGGSHVADLVMSEDAYKALQEGASLEITTVKKFKETYGLK